jgi:uncharacterized protein YbjT (DUF2867 family)
VTVAVFGATGVIGRALVPVLAEREEVVAISRQPEGQQREGVRALAADVTDAESVRRALEGVEVAYYLVHSLGSPDYAELAAVASVYRTPDWWGEQAS